jgi:hypothetical protein
MSIDFAEILRNQIADWEQTIAALESGKLRVAENGEDITEQWIVSLKAKRQELISVLGNVSSVVQIPQIDLRYATKEQVDRFFADPKA